MTARSAAPGASGSSLAAPRVGAAARTRVGAGARFAPATLAAAGAVAAFGGLAGCAPSAATPPGELPPEGPHAELGTGSSAFEPLRDGDVLPVERGSQGGVHVYGAVRAWGVHGGAIDDIEAWTSQDRPTITFELASPEGVLSIEDPLRRALVPDGTGALVYGGAIVQFHYWVELPQDWTTWDWQEEERQLERTDLTLSVLVEDIAGTVVQDERAVRIQFPPRPDGA